MWGRSSACCAGLPAELGTLEESILQPGFRQVAAGYVVYGPSTVLVYTTGNGVHGFTLDPTIGAFVLSNERMRMPEQGSYYSVNEANAAGWPEEISGRMWTMLRDGRAGEGVQLALHREPGGGLSPHAAEGWGVSLSADG